MAEIYVRGRTYWCHGVDRSGKRWYRTTKVREPNKAAARQVARQIEMEIASGADHAQNASKSDRLTLEAAVILMIEAAERTERSTHTIKFLETKSRHLMRVLGATKRCSEITLTDTTAYMDQRVREHASRHTALLELRTLVQALRRAAKVGKFVPKVDPLHLRPDELRGAYVPRERWLPTEELTMLLAELAPDRQDYVTVMAWCGLRLSELHGVLAGDVDLKGNELRLRGTKTKGSRRRIPLAPAARETLERRAKDKKASHVLFPEWGNVQRDLDAACLRIEAKLNPGWERPQGRAGHATSERATDDVLPTKRDVKGRPPSKKNRVRPPVPFDTVSPNDLRRTFASWLANAGVPQQQARELMGHASTAMLDKVYARLAPQTLHTAIAMIAPQPVPKKRAPTPTKGKPRAEGLSRTV